MQQCCVFAKVPLTSIHGDKGGFYFGVAVILMLYLRSSLPFAVSLSRRAVQKSALCRSRRELSNAYFLAKFGFDTAENEPSKVCPIERSDATLARV